ncbi:MAG TPA: hypothetical protein VJI69_00010 [Bacteroidia bacterium]|nr:hypothetical protein [Bacteroidia bacterium]
MKKNVFLIAYLIVLASSLSAQTRSTTRVDVPEKGISLTAENVSVTDNSCTLEGNVTEEPIMKLPYITAHNVPGILTNINQIGSTWVIQCTAGPGYCFTWYDPR